MEVGAHVVHGGRTWQVVAVQGQRVYLLGEDEAEKSLLVGRLFADPGFEVVGGRTAEEVPQWGLFETVPDKARERALAWQRHIREVETGLAAGPGGTGLPRPEYDPERWTLAERERAKAEEMTALGFTRVSGATVERMRRAYRTQGLWGLVDKRTTRRASVTGRCDERVVAAVVEALRRQRGRSKGTVKGLSRLAGQILEETHGPGVVALPSRATLYRLVNALADPAELPGRPARTATASSRSFTPTVVLRPGEQVQIDTTRLDVMAVLEDGTVGRPELTIAVDVATRSIVAAVLRPVGTKAVDAALLLAEMAVPHPVRPGWSQALRLSAAAVPYARLLTLDQRLEGAAGRPVIVPETIVVDRGKVFVSEAFVAACETLGVSVQPTPPRRPAAKGVVERTFGAINTLFCQHVAGYTGSNVTRRGHDVEGEACWSVAQLQDLFDEWVTAGWQNRPHDGLRHPVLPRAALTPNQAWAALVAVCGYVPLPLTGRDYLELLPVRWHRVTDRGIRIDHRTYDHEVLGPLRGQSSGIVARDGKWEVHHNPHDGRQVWVRLPDGELTEIPWIHRDHVHRPFDDRTWRQVKADVDRRGGHEQHEAELAGVLDALLRRARTGVGHDGDRRETVDGGKAGGARARAGSRTFGAFSDALRGSGARPPAEAGDLDGAAACAGGADGGERAGAVSYFGGRPMPPEARDSLDHLDDDNEDRDERERESRGPVVGGFELYDAQAEAERW